MHCMQADIYSFGMLMWEIVMGTMPWERMHRLCIKLKMEA